MEVSAESDESLGGLEAEVGRCDVKRAAVLKLLAGVVHVDALQRLNGFRTNERSGLLARLTFAKWQKKSTFCYHKI